MEGNQTDYSQLLGLLAQIVPPLAKTLGPDAEVVLHDFANPQSSIIAAEGSVTGRRVGGPVTDLLLRLLRQGKTDHLVAYRTRTSDGRILRSSSIFIKDHQGKPVGCLCINTDITFWLKTEELISNYVALGVQGRHDEVGGQEKFVHDIEELMQSMVDEAVRLVGIPVPLMKKEHKVQVVMMLDDNGVFLVRGAVDYVAHALGISRYTVYNYLDEGRGSKDAVVLG
ncbi:MAG: transcriptional regulator [Firmicutes bacterium]|jgi:predicted transcriptional regulator YheO|nr:transcriptional regulator [Bacillota bacterium]